MIIISQDKQKIAIFENAKQICLEPKLFGVYQNPVAKTAICVDGVSFGLFVSADNATLVLQRIISAQQFEAKCYEIPEDTQ